MRKIKFVTTEAVLIAAVIAAVLRFWEIKTVFEPLTGLAKQYAFVSVLLVLLTVAVIGASVWYGIAVVHKGCVNVDPERPFPTTNKLAQLVCIVTGAIVVFLYEINEGFSAAV